MERWAFRIAANHGILDPERDVLDAIPRPLLVKWIAFFQLEPPAARRADIRQQIHTLKLVEAIRGEVTQEDLDDLTFEFGPSESPDVPNDQDEAEEMRQRQMLSTVLTHFTK